MWDIEVIRLLYYLPMERMENFKDKVDRLVWEYIEELKEENKNLKDRINELIWKIDQLEEENENLSKDLFHLTNDGQRKNPTATQWAEWVIREWGEE